MKKPSMKRKKRLKKIRQAQEALGAVFEDVMSGPPA
jgi:hypothetical protein